MAVFKLNNTIQEYAWGSKTAIPGLLGYENNENKPLAELWMGAHPKAPSTLMLDDGVKKGLNEAIEEAPSRMLGEKIAAQFGGRLPYLFKVLAAGSPLSIQAHPNLQQAAEGFARENAAGTALDAFNRSYKDDNHKPEIICALTDFYAMRGFRPAYEIASDFKKIMVQEIELELSALENASDETEALKTFFSKLMNLEESVAEGLIGRAVDSAEDFEQGSWIRRFSQLYPGDIGILSPLYLNVVQLKPGEAMYLPAGELHAYLDGTGMELMANSDNVLRGGLTPKYVDEPELLSTLTFGAGRPEILKPEALNETESVYSTGAPEFCLSRIELENKYVFPDTPGNPELPSILICLEGAAEITDKVQPNEPAVEISRGDSVFISYGSHPVLSGCGTFYRASMPGDSPAEAGSSAY